MKNVTINDSMITELSDEQAENVHGGMGSAQDMTSTRNPDETGGSKPPVHNTGLIMWVGKPEPEVAKII